MNDAVEADISGLCGFSRCRAPLPGPGPKGGRPFAYCPERAWPGGKTCKQLAGAQEALAEALGDAGSAELLSATATFTATAERVAGPLSSLLEAAEALRGSLAREAEAAITRAERAEAAAATERGLRETAEAVVAEARETAAASVREAKAAADAAVREAQSTAAAEVQLAQVAAAADVQLVRSEAEAEIQRAREAADAEAEEARATAAAEVRRVRDETDLKLLAAGDAVEAAESETERHRLDRDRAQAQARAGRDAATRSDLAKARAEGTAVTEHDRAEAAVQALAAVTAERDKAHAAQTHLRDELAQARAVTADHAAHLAKTAADLTAATHRADTHERRLTALRDVLLDDSEGDVRTRLLAVLLDRTPATERP